jgi:flagellar basal-body rod modification protein FlgD
MPTTTATTAPSAADIYSSIGINNPAPATRGNAEVGQNDFLRLMLEQLRNQDPLNPKEGADFIAQLAQFSTVSGIEKLSDGFSGMVDAMRGSQALSAAGLVGRDALIVGSTATLGDGEDAAIDGAVQVPASGAVRVEVLDAAGAVVRTISLGSQPAGLADFRWDGTNDAGNRVAAGKYSFRAAVNGTAATTLVEARIESVSLGADGAGLMLAGIGSYPIQSVRRFS